MLPNAVQAWFVEFQAAYATWGAVAGVASWPAVLAPTIQIAAEASTATWIPGFAMMWSAVLTRTKTASRMTPTVSIYVVPAMRVVLAHWFAICAMVSAILPPRVVNRPKNVCVAGAVRLTKALTAKLVFVCEEEAALVFNR